jgi:hypothetical protein
MTYEGRSITEQIPAGRDRTVQRITRVISKETVDTHTYYKVKIMTPGFGAILHLTETAVKKLFNDDKNI